MEKRNYPIERKLAPTWQCQVCGKIMSSRGKSGHMEKVHNRIIPLKEHCPWLFIGPIVRKKRPVARSDMRYLIAWVGVLLHYCNASNDLLVKRKRLLECEYVFRELEIKFNCTLEEAVEKFPELQQITEVKN